MPSDPSLCWSCRREHAEESTAAKVPLYFVRYAEYGSSIYSEAFVVVPRGRSCARVDRVERFGVVKIPAWMTVIAFMLALPFHDDVAVQWPIAVACAGVVTMAASGLFVRGKGAQRSWTHPDVLALKQQGWRIGPPHNGGRPLSRRDQRKLRAFGRPLPGGQPPAGGTGRGRFDLRFLGRPLPDEEPLPTDARRGLGHPSDEGPDPGPGSGRSQQPSPATQSRDPSGAARGATAAAQLRPPMPPPGGTRPGGPERSRRRH